MLRTTSRRASLAAHLLEASTCVHRLEVDVELVGQGLVHGGGGAVAADCCSSSRRSGAGGQAGQTGSDGGGWRWRRCTPMRPIGAAAKILVLA